MIQFETQVLYPQIYERFEEIFETIKKSSKTIPEIIRIIEEDPNTHPGLSYAYFRHFFMEALTQGKTKLAFAILNRFKDEILSETLFFVLVGFEVPENVFRKVFEIFIDHRNADGYTVLMLIKTIINHDHDYATELFQMNYFKNITDSDWINFIETANVTVEEHTRNRWKLLMQFSGFEKAVLQNEKLFKRLYPETSSAFLF